MKTPSFGPFFIFWAILSLHTACNLSPEPLDIAIEEPPQRLVISSYWIPPQGAIFTFTRTFSALLGEDSIDLNDSYIIDRVLIDDALGIIRYNGTVDTLFKISPGVYGSLNTTQFLATDYVLELTDFKTQQTVRAVTRFLPKIPLDTVYPVQRILPNLGDTLFTFNFQFTDITGVENYYLATYTNINTLAENFALGGGLFNFNQIQFNVFSDKNNGDGMPIQYQPDIGGSAGDTLVVSLSNISKGYYEFLAAYKRSGNLLSQLTGEPVNLPTNVEGGYGYFALIRPSARTVILQ